VAGALHHVLSLQAKLTLGAGRTTMVLVTVLVQLDETVATSVTVYVPAMVYT
jgi:hypothetical protein